MSDRPKIKKITNTDEATSDECIYYLQYNPEMTQIMLTIQAQREMTPEEYMLALAAFVDDASEHPHKLFVEDVDGDVNSDLH